MAKIFQCHVCGKPTPRLEARMFLSLAPENGSSGSMDHNKYNYRADVGECCAQKLIKLFRFQPRRTRQEYLEKARRRQS